MTQSRVTINLEVKPLSLGNFAKRTPFHKRSTLVIVNELDLALAKEDWWTVRDYVRSMPPMALVKFLLLMTSDEIREVIHWIQSSHEYLSSVLDAIILVILRGVGSTTYKNASLATVIDYVLALGATSRSFANACSHLAAYGPVELLESMSRSPQWTPKIADNCLFQTVLSRLTQDKKREMVSLLLGSGVNECLVDLGTLYRYLDAETAYQIIQHVAK